TREYKQDHGEALYRRSLYTYWKRTAPPPAFTTFDAPSREQSCTRRERSNTPLQALLLMNDVQHFEAARAFGERILEQGGSNVRGQIEWAFREATGRRPDNDELKILMNLHDKSLAEFKEDPADAGKLLAIGDSTVPDHAKPAELAAMSNVARTILNLHEVITRD
ncbi:MAG: DUF1553 domain-containing protein, partial [Acidobacteriota bacterium]